MDEARKQVDVFVALAGEKHEASVAARAAHAEQEKKIAALKETLKADILAAAKTPADVYKGADKATLKGLVEAEWKKLYPTDQLLGVKFIQPEWKRKRGADWSAAWKRWEDYDRSEMVVRVVVRNDEKISTLYFVYITKDHMSNDLLTVGAKTKTANYVQEKMLTSNYEP